MSICKLGNLLKQSKAIPTPWSSEFSNLFWRQGQFASSAHPPLLSARCDIGSIVVPSAIIIWSCCSPLLLFPGTLSPLSGGRPPRGRTRCGTRMPWLLVTLSSCTCTGMQAPGEEEELMHVSSVQCWLLCEQEYPGPSGLLTHCNEGAGTWGTEEKTEFLWGLLEGGF